MKHIFSAKSLKREQFPGCPHGCGPGYPSIMSKLLTYNLRGISRLSSHVWYCNASLNNNSFGTGITCNLTRLWFATATGEVQLEF